MDSVDQRSLSYSPQCSWFADEPSIYFNTDTLCHGEQLKVLLSVPKTWQELRNKLYEELVHDEAIKLDIVSLEQEEPEVTVPLRILYEDHTRRYDPDPLIATLNTGVERLLPGSYVAQVASYAEQQREVLGEHRFHVLGVDQYDEFWRELFGETWDDPIYWDSMETDQAAELAQRLPMDALPEHLSEEITKDGQSTYQFLGPIITACMISDLGHLPFKVTYPKISPIPSLPHVDLTKLMWLLRVLAPTWADAAFFSPELELGYEIWNETAIKVNLWYESVDYSGADHEVPRLYELVEEALGEQALHMTTWTPTEGHLSFIYEDNADSVGYALTPKLHEK